jgi:Tfp pilus assembly protein PilF
MRPHGHGNYAPQLPPGDMVIAYVTATIRSIWLEPLMRKLLLWAVYIAIIGAVYSVAVDAPFVYDDRIHIIENPLVLGFHSAFDTATWKALVQTPYGWAGRPLLFLTYGITYAVSGLDVSIFRITNIAIHFINALLVFAIARLLAGAAGRNRAESTWIAWVAGLLFAVHPLATESVVYVAGRSSSLCALFYFAAIAALLKARDASRSAVWMWTSLAAASFAASLLVKQDAMVLPAVAFALILLSWPAMSLRRRTVAIVLIIAIGAGAWFLQRASMENVRQTTLDNEILVAAGFNRTLTPAVYTRTAVKEWTFYYLWRLFLPVHLSIDPAPRDVTYPGAPLFLISVAVIAGLCVAAVWAVRRDRLLSSSLALILISPLAGYCLFPLADVVSEHRAYITLLGGAVLTAAGLARLPHRVWWAAAVLLIYAPLTVGRNQVWTDECRLWEDASRKAPGALRPHLNLGAIYQTRGMPDRAAQEYNVVLASAPGHDAASANLGSIYLDQGRLDLAESLLNKAVERQSGFAAVYLNLGVVRLRQHRYTEAKEMLEHARRLNPRQLMIGLNLGDIAFNERRFGDAINEYLGELKLNPDSVITHLHLAKAYEAIRAVPEAIQQYRTVLKYGAGDSDVIESLRRLDPGFGASLVR